MLNALPMSIFGPLSFCYWIYYTFFDPILRLFGLSGSRRENEVHVNGSANGYAKMELEKA